MLEFLPLHFELESTSGSTDMFMDTGLMTLDSCSDRYSSLYDGGTILISKDQVSRHELHQIPQQIFSLSALEMEPPDFSSGPKPISGSPNPLSFSLSGSWTTRIWWANPIWWPLLLPSRKQIQVQCKSCLVELKRHVRPWPIDQGREAEAQKS